MPAHVRPVARLCVGPVAALTSRCQLAESFWRGNQFDEARLHTQRGRAGRVKKQSSTPAKRGSREATAKARNLAVLKDASSTQPQVCPVRSLGSRYDGRHRPAGYPARAGSTVTMQPVAAASPHARLIDAQQGGDLEACAGGIDQQRRVATMSAAASTNSVGSSTNPAASSGHASSSVSAAASDLMAGSVFNAPSDRSAANGLAFVPSRAATT